MFLRLPLIRSAVHRSSCIPARSFADLSFKQDRQFIPSDPQPKDDKQLHPSNRVQSDSPSQLQNERPQFNKTDRRDIHNYQPYSNSYASRPADQFQQYLNELTENEVPNPTPIHPDRLRFYDAIASKRTINAWAAYNKIMISNPDSLSILDHMQYINLLRFTRKSSDIEAMQAVFQNLESLNVDMPVPVYDVMIQCARFVSPETVDTYVNKMVIKHGVSALTASTYAARMNAYRRSNQFEKVIDVANEADAAGIHTHSLKPLVCIAHLLLDNKDSAVQVFDSYVANERSFINIAKIHAWMADIHIDKQQVDQARALVQNLDNLQIRPNYGMMLVQMRLAIHDQDLKSAQALATNVVEMSPNDVFGKSMEHLIAALLEANHFDQLDQLLAVYSNKYTQIPNLRFSPYVKCMEFHANKNNVGAKGVAEIERMFNLIPTRAKLYNRSVLKSTMAAYVQAGDVGRARNLLSAAQQAGLPVHDDQVNSAWIGTLVESTKVGPKIAHHHHHNVLVDGQEPVLSPALTDPVTSTLHVDPALSNGGIHPRDSAAPLV